MPLYSKPRRRVSSERLETPLLVDFSILQDVGYLFVQFVYSLNVARIKA